MLVLAARARWWVIGHELDRLDDPDGYLGLARSVVRGEGLRINGRLTAYRPPLYPILLAPWVWAFEGRLLATSLAVFHTILGALTVLLVADSGRRWGLPAWSSGIATGIAALDPVLLVQARSLMTETLAACLLATTIWGFALGGNRGAIAGGIGCGLAALCRPSLLPAPFLLALAGLFLGPGPRPGRVERSLLVLVATLGVVCPWAIRNAVVVGEPVWTTTHGGYTLALANNPAYSADVVLGQSGTVWSGPNQEAWIRALNAATAGLSEPESDRLLRRQAIDFARAHPADFARATAARLGRFWGIMPSSAVYPPRVRWPTAAWTVCLWTAVGLGFCRAATWRWSHLAAVVAILTLTLIHSVYWTDLRMRAPLVPAFALIAAVGISGLTDRRRHAVPAA